MTSQAPIVGLHVQSRAQSLTLVRGMLSGVAEQLSMDPELLDDLKTSVSEACNNAVLHAYGGQPGPMDVELFVGDDQILVSVQDGGVGLRTHRRSSSTTVPEGSACQSCRRSRELRAASARGRRDRGADVFEGRRDDRRCSPCRPRDRRPPAGGGRPGAENEVMVSVSPVALLSSVLGRVARTVAATAHFSLDRFSDVYLITDALAAHADRAADGERITARLTASERQLSLSLGPFRRGSGALLDAAAPSPLSMLANELTVSECGSGDAVTLVVLDER